MLCLFTLKSHKTVPPFQILVASCGFEDDPQWVQLCYKSAAAAAKSLQSCPTLCDPIDSSPLGSPVPGILQARILEWVAISFSSAWKWKVKVKVLSRVPLFATPWTAAYQGHPWDSPGKSTGVGGHCLLLISNNKNVYSSVLTLLLTISSHFSLLGF